MKLEWRRRAPARSWLLLRPGVIWDWLLVENGVAQREGQGEPPANLDAKVALIIPGERCSQFELAAPPGLKRDEWPLLLEDHLLQLLAHDPTGFAGGVQVCRGFQHQALFAGVETQALALQP